MHRPLRGLFARDGARAAHVETSLLLLEGTQMNSRTIWTARATAGAALAVMLLASCSSSGDETSGSNAPGGSTGGSNASGTNCSSLPDGPIKIANIEPLTGPAASSGQIVQQLVAVAATYFNEHSDICGRKIDVTDYNDKFDPAAALSFGRKVVSDGKTIVINDSFGSVQQQLHAYFMKNHVLVMNGSSSAELFDPDKNPTGFSSLPSNKLYAKGMVDWAKSQHFDKIGTMSDGSLLGDEIAADIKSDAKEAGLTVMSTVVFSPTAVDLSTQIQEAKRAGVETLMITAYTGVPALVSGLKQVGWAPHVIGWGNLNIYGVSQAQLPADAVDGCIYYYAQGEPASNLLTPEVTALLKASAAKFGINANTANVLGGYMQLQLIKHAIENAGSLDGKKLAEVLENTKLETVMPNVTQSFSSSEQHNGWPAEHFKMCQLKRGEYGIEYLAPGAA